MGGISYHIEQLTGGMKELKGKYDEAQLLVLERLNRVDLDHLARVSRYVAPDAWAFDELAYSPLPQTYASAESQPKLLVIHVPVQAFAAYEYGRLVKWGPTSTGRRDSPTPSGMFHLNWKSRGRHSSVDPEWFMRWYFNFENERGLSLHEYALPGVPASHSCVRLLAADARWLYTWGEEWRFDPSARHLLSSGTPVLILGRYDFGATPPWRSMESLARSVELPASLFSER